MPMIQMTAEQRIDELYNEAANEDLASTPRGLTASRQLIQAARQIAEQHPNRNDIINVPALRDIESTASNSNSDSSTVMLPYDPLEDALRMANSSLHGNVHTMPPLAIVLQAVRTLMNDQGLGSLEELLTNSSRGRIRGLLMSRPMRMVWIKYLRDPEQGLTNIGIINSLIREINLAYGRLPENDTVPEDLVELVDSRSQARREYQVEHHDQNRLYNWDEDEALDGHIKNGTLPDIILEIRVYETSSESRQRLAARRRFISNILREGNGSSPPPGYVDPYTSEYTRFTATLLITWTHDIFAPRAQEICNEINRGIIEGNFERQIEPERGIIKFEELKAFLDRGRRLMHESHESEEISTLYADFRDFCRKEQYPPDWANVIRPRLGGPLAPSTNNVVGETLQSPDTPITSGSPTSQESADSPTARSPIPFPDFWASGVEMEEDGMSPQWRRESLIGADSAVGLTAQGQKILAYRIQGSGRQCIVEEGPAEDRKYVLRAQSKIGGVDIVNAAINEANIPLLGKDDGALLSQRKVLGFEEITKTALVPYAQGIRSRRNLPVCFFWVRWGNHEDCWVSRTMLSRLIGNSVVGDGALKALMSELRMPMPPVASNNHDTSNQTED